MSNSGKETLFPQDPAGPTKKELEAESKRQAEMAEECSQLKEELGLGPTGEYPEGMLSPHDEGAMKFGITSKEGRIFFVFGSPVSWFAMTPEQVEEIMSALDYHVNKIRSEGGPQIIVPGGAL